MHLTLDMILSSATKVCNEIYTATIIKFFLWREDACFE